MSQRAVVLVTISNRLGLHARPAMAFVETAGEYAARVIVKRAGDSEEVDGKSIMHMMMLAATKGTQLEICAEGADAERAAAALKKLVEGRFGED